ncbi:hypothetical protein B484DRAFT_440916, partial [Ochromonadaceae sp. CCMP2298]
MTQLKRKTNLRSPVAREVGGNSKKFGFSAKSPVHQPEGRSECHDHFSDAGEEPDDESSEMFGIMFPLKVVTLSPARMDNESVTAEGSLPLEVAPARKKAKRKKKSKAKQPARMDNESVTAEGSLPLE